MSLTPPTAPDAVTRERAGRRAVPLPMATRDHVRMQDLRRFFKANPQVLVLLIICLVLGLGTFLAVVFGVVTSKNPTTASGEPSGSLTPRVTLVARTQTPVTLAAHA